jgi:hypothetical protein
VSSFPVFPSSQVSQGSSTVLLPQTFVHGAVLVVVVEVEVVVGPMTEDVVLEEVVVVEVVLVLVVPPEPPGSARALIVHGTSSTGTVDPMGSVASTTVHVKSAGRTPEPATQSKRTRVKSPGGNGSARAYVICNVSSVPSPLRSRSFGAKKAPAGVRSVTRVVSVVTPDPG